jgi:hypothetical protein
MTQRYCLLMPKSFATADWFIPFVLNLCVTIFLFTIAIVLIFRTLVKMENEVNFIKKATQRLAELRESVEGLGFRDIAEDYKKDYKLETFHHSQIQRWEKRACIYYILWFCNRYDFNEDFVIYGGDLKHSKVHRPKFLP